MRVETKPLRDPLNRPFYLPRLSREHYQGDAVVHWTLTTFDRARGWLTDDFHLRFDWRFTGAVVLGYPRLHPMDSDYWPMFWKLHAKLRHADAGNIVRPPI
jgi:hypothetical protein